MSNLIKFEIKGLKELQRTLNPKKFAQVANRVVNDITKKVNRETIKEIRKRYNISAERLKKNIKVRPSNYQTLEAKIIYKGRTPGLQHYKMRQVSGNILYYSTKIGIAGKKLKRKRKQNSVTVEVIKGHRVKVKNAFLLFPKHGGIGIFKRKGKSRYPIYRLYGPSPRGMAKQVGVEKIFKKITEKEGGNILERALKRYLRIF